MNENITVPNLICEYGEAVRYNWGDIDGRGVRQDMWELAAAVERYGTDPLPDEVVARLRSSLDLCPGGHGCWTDDCPDCGRGSWV